MLRYPALGLLFSLLTLVAAGCGGDGRSSARVSGKVTVKGQPMADIRVNFEPVGSGAGRGSTGVTDTTGNYTLSFVDNNQSGALVGKHQVSFTDMKNIGGADEPDGGPSMPVRKSRLPPSATQPREQEVKAGSNQADFDLQ